MALDFFYLQLLLSFIVGGVVIATAITVSEKLSHKLGAIILTFPNTIAVSLFFIALTGSIGTMDQAVPFSIIGSAIYIVFLTLFILLVSKYGRKTLFISMIAWLILAIAAIAFRSSDFFTAILAFLIVYFPASIYMLRKGAGETENAANPKKGFIYRAVFSGLMISFAVFLSKALDPAWGGVFAVFPASTFSAFWLMLDSQSTVFVKALAKRMLPFAINYPIYATLVYLLYPILGIYVGTLASIAVTAVFVYATFSIIKNSKRINF